MTGSQETGLTRAADQVSDVFIAETSRYKYPATKLKQFRAVSLGENKQYSPCPGQICG